MKNYENRRLIVNEDGASFEYYSDKEKLPKKFFIVVIVCVVLILSLLLLF